jgi:hypothetical protein
VRHRPRHATLRRRKAAKSTDRHFVSLTQVNRQIRQEFRPLYLTKMEFGIDLKDVKTYLNTFYPSARSGIMVNENWYGQLTIAMDNPVSASEKGPKGVDMWPLLNFWVQGHKIELAFGIYENHNYGAKGDCEARDLYRLCGRRVKDQQCSKVNEAWRQLLGKGGIAATRIHREPKDEEPFIHILFKPDYREEWMDQEVSKVPNEWLEQMGFKHMEHFNVKVGIHIGDDENDE